MIEKIYKKETWMENKLLKIINFIKENKSETLVDKLNFDADLQNDYGFDSLDLAELTVRIEKEFGTDIFADGFVKTVKDVIEKLTNE